MDDWQSRLRSVLDMATSGPEPLQRWHGRRHRLELGCILKRFVGHCSGGRFVATETASLILLEIVFLDM